MKRFTKLHDHNGDPIWIDFAQDPVVGIHHRLGKVTVLITACGRNYEVSESPEEVLRQIGEAG